MLRSLVFQTAVVSRIVVRSLSTAQPVEIEKVDKAALLELRKNTGYSYVNCRKALLKFGSHNLAEAEKWLRKNAEKEGWAKAAKLSSRKTNHGLVSVLSSGNIAAIVELSCETDFVSRGEAFKELLATLTNDVIAYAEKNVGNGKRIGNKLVRQILDIETLTTPDGKSLKEIMAMSVGRLGENITAKKIEVFHAPEGSELYGAAHPKEGTDSIPMGKFASIIALKREKVEGLFPSNRLAAQLCQHIIGMRSETLGTPPTVGDETQRETKSLDNEDELNNFFKGQVTELDENETALLKQAFMLNPSQTIHEYVTGHQAEIVDFARVELSGQKSDN